METIVKPRRLRVAVQNYDWGRTGEDAAVARLFSLNDPNSPIDLSLPFAELWIGTHPSGPSFLFPDDSDSEGVVPLKDWILQNPSAVLGSEVAKRWRDDLPFLFKVLSVSKALSIQAHPDKELAEVLHKMRPNVYKDSNHKPEMAIALSEFKALCGFVSLEELKDVLTSVPEIGEIVGDEHVDRIMTFKETDACEEIKIALQSIYTKLMLASQETVSEQVSKLMHRLNAENKDRILTEKEQLALQLEKQYPSDIGVISAFFFNYVKLIPGEALSIGANEPHAYISGECIECMATSDNVVRAGLTPKYKDVQTLCSMLTYKQGFPEVLQGTPLNDHVSRYTPPFDEFEVDRISLPPAESLEFPAIPGPSIFIVVAGQGSMQMSSTTAGEMIMEGNAFFVPAKNEIKFSAGVSGGLQLYRAGVNSKFFD
ncbi:Mannose-6-phosphate isomerase type I protein [Dioscorea alata]|uniref:Mannose-6-phosphate isomerase type I protein n=3 Tax=Dioscorea alata TaxID=55571 RepID=A0ACB7W550_DIOAL|nr:Mannose-6-phosphate isomerase type I protein [Dioscorea alata]KAH7682628.1 Mannose-6-phosphate isomerase type I protein [Dioscorea alata]